ncbi:hypothetical protein ACA910_015132 [Epithemia clementina (nom. ined.)]
MDARKRPRNSDGTKESPPKKKSKGSKNKMKTKRNRAYSEGNSSMTTKPNKNSMENTATTDGQMMAQMLSTFSKLEQSRFEAFQRVSFPVDAIGDWVAACLSDRLHLLPTIRPLEDLVAVGHAGEIRTVVAVLAKIYAQRLVQTAARIASQSGRDPSVPTAPTTTTTTTTITTTAGANPAALQPSDVLAAYEERRAQGLDPGFFLQDAAERPYFVLESKQSVDQRRLAALQAQEEYDNEKAKESSAENITTSGESIMDMDQS